jgi:hypothetical protein
MANFQSANGIITMINDLGVGANNDGGCYKLVSVDNGQGLFVNFVVEPTTYFVDHIMIRIGDRIIGFYDANVPVPLIYPPQYRAVVIAADSPNQHVKVDYFNEQLESSDGQLRLNVSPNTPILLENGQQFTGNLINRNLIVSYGATTKSIPAQTTPSQIIVMC